MDFRYVRIIITIPLKSFIYPPKPPLSLITIVPLSIEAKRGKCFRLVKRTGCDGRDDNRSFLQYIEGRRISGEEVRYKDLVFQPENYITIPFKIWEQGRRLSEYKKQ